MRAFSLLLSIALVGCTFSLPQPVPQGWFSRFTGGVQGAANVANQGLGLANSAVQLATGIKGGSVQAGTNVAKLALSTGIGLKANTLQGATNLMGKGLDFAGSSMSGIPVVGTPLSILTSIGKTGLNAANAVEQAKLGAINSVGQAGLSGVNAATQLEMNTISSLANAGFGLGQKAVQAGANILGSGLKNGLLTNHMQQEVGTLVNGLSAGASNVAAQLNEGQEIIGDIKGKVTNIVHDLGSLANSNSVKEIGENVNIAKKKLENIKNEIATLIARNSDKPLGEKMKAMSASIGDILGELGAAVGGDTGADVMANFGNHIGKAVNELGTAINNSPLEKIMNTIGGVQNKLKTAVSDLSSTLAEQRNRPVEETIGKVGENIENMMGEVGLAFGGRNGKRILGNLGERVGNVMSEVGSTVGNSMQKISHVANGLGGQLGQAVGQIKSFIKAPNKEDLRQLMKNGPLSSLMQQYGGAVNAVADATSGASLSDRIGCSLGRTVVSQFSNAVLPLIAG